MWRSEKFRAESSELKVKSQERATLNSAIGVSEPREFFRDGVDDRREALFPQADYWGVSGIPIVPLKRCCRFP
jgi:hypothetical protein